MITTAEWVEDSVQIARMAKTLPRWLAEVPLYRGRAPRSGCPEQTDQFLHCFRSLPVISKREIRHGFPHNFLPPDVELRSLLDRDLVELERTSGTLEPATPLLLARGWWSEQERAILQLNDWVARAIESPVRRVTITSPVCSSELCYTGTLARSDRIVDQALFVNLSRHPFLWSETALSRMVEETLEWQPAFLDLDPVYGVLFARYCEEQGIRLPGLKFILSSYEFLSVVHRRRLQRVFGVPVFNLYGSTETGHLLMEDEAGRMLPNVASAFLEIINAGEDGVGELVVTTLTNHYMPLIRYSIGDLVRARPARFQTAFELHGRAQDALTSTRGHRVSVSQIDQCFEGFDGIVHYQLRQESDDRFTLYYVPDQTAVGGIDLPKLRLRLGDLFACNGGLRFEPVDYIPCESSGNSA
ncbi:MAG: hypothetical protein M1608_17590 [Candidatus Omnitrophica bacterium]|nr:hypothetical protein [Candidatus Omnitrophota bacterium]